MKKIVEVSLVVLIIISSCKKSSQENLYPSPYANNELKATVSLPGAPAFTIEAKGTIFITFIKQIYQNGDTIIIIAGGSSSNGEVEINLKNINLPGVYVFENRPSLRQYSIFKYGIGGQFGSNNGQFYSMLPGIPSGTITIEELTPTFIKGVFTATCYGPNGANGVAQITNGSFKGIFYKP